MNKSYEDGTDNNVNLDKLRDKYSILLGRMTDNLATVKKAQEKVYEITEPMLEYWQTTLNKEINSALEEINKEYKELIEKVLLQRNI